MAKKRFQRRAFYGPKSGLAIVAGADNDVEMDGGPVKDGDMDSRGQPALPPEKVNLCQYSGPLFVPAASEIN
jgi:hypothetical protein